MSYFNKKRFSVLNQAIETVSKIVGLRKKDPKWRPYWYILSQTRAHIMTINQHYSVSNAFSVPTWSEMCGVVDAWQFFYYRPPGKFRFTHLGEIVKMLCQELDIYMYIYIFMTLFIIDMDFLYQFNLGLIAPLFTVSFHEKFFFFFNFQKLAGVWLVGKVDNHVAMYGSKVAEGFSAFQRRSCLHFKIDAIWPSLSPCTAIYPI